MRRELENDIFADQGATTAVTIENLPERLQLAADIGESTIVSLVELESIES